MKGYASSSLGAFLENRDIHLDLSPKQFSFNLQENCFHASILIRLISIYEKSRLVPVGIHKITCK